ncbi:unnamed protein product [Lepeophtheirus salmonis]|uniref:(salmon louse) hypothetical protein n=1 Tax=Lepeophtheirus salmonis TaxID=72036 RepID=A0A7R8CRX8_LEPSM|nr:unnamed protein product [Lepeophtheirus salmonis]CAF2907062.1 unnamed protein product [Lepeophtheirus salmonis]
MDYVLLRTRSSRRREQPPLIPILIKISSCANSSYSLYNKRAGGRKNETYKTGSSIILREDKRMFKKFEEKESVSGITQLKSSVQKGIRAKILDAYPDIADYLDLFLPKKDAFRIVKCHEHIELLVNSSGALLFFRQRDSPLDPHTPPPPSIPLPFTSSNGGQRRH